MSDIEFALHSFSPSNREDLFDFLTISIAKKVSTTTNFYREIVEKDG